MAASSPPEPGWGDGGGGGEGGRPRGLGYSAAEISVDIGKAVCAKAEELGAEPLVVAAHDKGPIEELLLGSTSKYVAAHCKRPVLLLHPNHSNI